MNAPINPATVHKPLGMYSHTMRIPAHADWLVIVDGLAASDFHFEIEAWAAKAQRRS